MTCCLTLKVPICANVGCASSVPVLCDNGQNPVIQDIVLTSAKVIPLLNNYRHPILVRGKTGAGYDGSAIPDCIIT